MSKVQYTHEYIYSIIIPAKNEGKYIGCCLKSLRSQDFDPESFEIIVVDNGSIDNTIEVATEYKAKILTRHKGTIASLRNYGASEARGVFLGFIDADCAAHPCWLKNGLKLLTSKDVVAVGSPESWHDPNSSWVERCWCIILNSKHLGKACYQASWCSTQAMLINRSFFEEIDGFNESLVTCEDVDFCYRLRGKGIILKDNSVPHYHARGSKTLGEFFSRELWRGKENIKGCLSHGLTVSELPSTFGPIVFGGLVFFAIIFLLLFILVQSNCFLGISLILLLGAFALPVLMVFKKVGLPPYPNCNFSKLFIICLVYFTARACALIFSGRRKW